MSTSTKVSRVLVVLMAVQCEECREPPLASDDAQATNTRALSLRATQTGRSIVPLTVWRVCIATRSDIAERRDARARCTAKARELNWDVVRRVQLAPHSVDRSLATRRTDVLQHHSCPLIRLRLRRRRRRH